jgi:hypothetical protein
MNANRFPGFRAWASSLGLAVGLFCHGNTRAEVGVVIQPGSTIHRMAYILEITEDPSPITQIWERVTPTDEVHLALNPQGGVNGDGKPSLVTDANTGAIAAAWSRNSASGFDVVVSRFVGGAWTVPQVVVGSSADERDPQLVLDPNGTVHMFYWVDGSTPQVFHTVAPSDLSTWSAPDLVSEAGVSACRPAGAIHNGVLRVAYEVHNLGNGTAPRQVVLARLDNGSFVPEIVAVTNNLGSVDPQVHSHAGKLWVDWIDFETTEGSGELAWTRLNAQGQWDTIEYVPFADYLEREYRSRGGARLRAIE